MKVLFSPDAYKHPRLNEICKECYLRKLSNLDFCFAYYNSWYNCSSSCLLCGFETIRLFSIRKQEKHVRNFFSKCLLSSASTLSAPSMWHWKKVQKMVGPWWFLKYVCLWMRPMRYFAERWNQNSQYRMGVQGIHFQHIRVDWEYYKIKCRLFR